MNETRLNLKDLELMEGEHPGLISRIASISEALVRRDLSGALGGLEEFGRALRRHADVEEEIFLPAYHNLPGISRAGRAEYFVDEHRRIDSDYESLIMDLRGFSADAATDSGIVSFVERLGRFRNLLDHHFRREEKTLYPRLREEFS